MFDWNDEELAHIIWGEAGESDDHIVPYPEAHDTCLYEDRIKKEANEEAAEIKLTDQKKPIAKIDYHGCNVERNSQYGKNEGLSRGGFGTTSWTELSLSNAAKIHQDCVGSAVSKDLTEIANYESSRGDESARIENGSETQENQHEVREQGDFVDYGWANIGSFDDLDRIFSNDDQPFGHASLGNADEVWSSSKDVARTPEKTFPLFMNIQNSGLGALKSASEQFETKTEYMLDPTQHFTPSYEKMNSQQPAKESFDVTVLDMAGNSAAFNSHLVSLGTPNEFAEKENRQKKLIKSRKKFNKKSEGRQLQGLCSSLSPSPLQFQQYDSRFTPTVAPYVYGNMANYYPAIPALPHFHSREDSHKPVRPVYDASPCNANPLNTPNAPLKPPTMTPQEKIEKLRRRQKMRAMLAIQNQQQQLSHQVPCTENAQKFSNESRIQIMEGGKVDVGENLSPLPPLDPNTPMELDGSITISVADGCSVDTILYQLQDTIAKLDSGIRLCMRDSLFRLAQSAMQRHSDTSSISKSGRDELEGPKNEEISNRNRFASIPDVETETNPIDRSIAHLLFHRPPDSSVKCSETPGSPPVSSKLCLGRNMNGLMSLTRGFVPESSNSMQSLSQTGSKFACLFAEGDQSKNSPCIDSSENASSTEPPHGRAMDGEASHLRKLQFKSYIRPNGSSSNMGCGSSEIIPVKESLS